MYVLHQKVEFESKHFSLYLNNVKIEQVTSLGLTVGDNLSWTKHENNLWVPLFSSVGAL